MAEEKALYVYGIARASEDTQLGNVGLDQKPAYTLKAGECSVIVHGCPPKAYYSKDEQQVKTWVKAHQDVLDIASQKLGTLIPMSFNVIIKGTEPEKELRAWVETEHDRLQALLTKLDGKNEFSVQVFWDKTFFEEKTTSQDPRAQQLLASAKAATPGKAYFYQQQALEEAKNALEKQADAWFKDFYKKIAEQAVEVKVEKTRQNQNGKPMLLNLSCLVPKDNVHRLGTVLDEIQSQDGFTVRFTGPWPPYSFVV